MKPPVWRWPLALACLTVFGLLAALLGGEGAWRWAAWMALAIPMATLARRSFAYPP